MNSAVETFASPMGHEGQVWPLSVAAYHVLARAGLVPENTELLYGSIYRKMAKSAYRSALVARLRRLIEASLPSEFFTRIEQPITCLDSEPEPDLAVIRGSEESFWEEHPRGAELIIEVCVTSYEYDRSKLPAYAAAGVKECWLVLGLEKKIEVYLGPESGGYQQMSDYLASSSITSSALPSISFPLQALFLK